MNKFDVAHFFSGLFLEPYFNGDDVTEQMCINVVEKTYTKIEATDAVVKSLINN